ncbi:MAG: hypothetical protein IKK47_06045 [Ruminococcus sp.]|nr:hypothetical protein [Ruminococcus sp.]
MKYTVMECHEGYAVLMGEDSRFVRAANLHYSVGQTVTSPVILAEDTKQSPISRSVFIKIAAAAACITLVSALGLNYYHKNLETRSVLTIGSDFNIQIELNSKGQVIRMESNSTDGKKVLEHYKTKDKNMVNTVNDILDVMKEEGYITNEDTVDVYISADSEKTYTSYKDEIENELSAKNVNVSTADKIKPQKIVPPEPIPENTDRMEQNKVPPEPTTENTENVEKTTIHHEPSVEKTDKIEKPYVSPDKNADKPVIDNQKPLPADPETDRNVNKDLPLKQLPNENKTNPVPSYRNEAPLEEPHLPHESHPQENKTDFPPSHHENNMRDFPEK